MGIPRAACSASSGHLQSIPCAPGLSIAEDYDRYWHRELRLLGRDDGSVPALASQVEVA